ncbi:MAG: porin family protein [Candidatus Saccharicenans sp.]|uniref:porin family protein n=1 Tax=Candidatus Saccharicenans sp. TaxID=2819258 RepID=UPI004049DE39
MKKAIVLFLMILMIALFASQARALVSFGVKGGLNNSKIVFSPALDMPGQKYLQGYCFGAFLSLNFGPIGLQPEILYSRRGMESQMLLDPSDPSSLAQAQALLDYIEIPLLVRLNVIPAGPVKLYIFGGPSYGFLQKAKARITYLGMSEEEDIKDDFKSNSLAAVGGLGLDIKIPLLFKITADARYHYGLSNILSEDTSVPTDKARNSGFSLMLGIGF